MPSGRTTPGFALKEELAEHLVARGIEVVDLGTHSPDRVDYPDYGAAVGRAVVDGRAELGVAVCGSGLGICMAANKVAGVRAATVHDVTSARLTRQHNDANVICLGERLIGHRGRQGRASMPGSRPASRVDATPTVSPSSTRSPRPTSPG